MIYTRDHLLRLVRARKGLALEPSPLIPCECDCTSVADSVLLDAVLAAAAEVMLTADAEQLAEVLQRFDTADILWHREAPDRYVGTICLPPRFMRLVTFAMSDWSMPVHRFTEPDSLQYALYSSGQHALAGNPGRPLCIEGECAGGPALVFASCRSSRAHIARSGYLLYPGFDTSGGIALPSPLLHTIIDRSVDC